MSEVVRRGAAALAACALVVPALSIAQNWRPSSVRSETIEFASHFTFTRIRYGSGMRGGFGGASWSHDYPAADRNLSAILDYITNMRVRLNPTNVLGLDDPRVFNNPIIYISEPGFWTIRESEAKNLRDYLLKGGFVIFDDFDGEDQWSNMAAQMARALPEHVFIDITPEHPIFHVFFDVRDLYVPNEVVRKTPVYRAIFENNDPSRRMIALANYNNDIAEYWEWSAEGLFDPDPVNNAYRLGVNYILYAMTH